MNYCSNCGKILKDGNKYCPRCGTRVLTAPDTPEKTNQAESTVRHRINNYIRIIIFLTVLLIVLSAAVGVIFFRTRKTDHLSEKISAGEKYLSDLDYDHAIDAFDEVLDKDPQNEDALVGIAQSYEGRGRKRLQEGTSISEARKDLTAARDYYERAVQYHPDSERSQQVQNALAEVNETLSYHPEQSDIYTLEGDNYASADIVRVCGRLVKAEYSPPFSDYSVLDENFNYVNYSENRPGGYQYDVVCKWGVQLEEPIQVSFNGKLITVDEIGLILPDQEEYRSLQENDYYYCEGVIQNLYQMSLDSYKGNGDAYLTETEKNIDRKGYMEGDTEYTSIHEYYPFGDYVSVVSKMVHIDEKNEDPERPAGETGKKPGEADPGQESALKGWGGRDRHDRVDYRDAENELDYLSNNPGEGRTEFTGTYKIERSYSSTQDGNTYRSNSNLLSASYTADDASDLGLLYGAADDFDGDLKAELLTFRTETVTHVDGNPYVYWYGQLDSFGNSSSSYQFGDKFLDSGEVQFVVIDHYLIQVSRVYDNGYVWPVAESEVDDLALEFNELIEVQDLNNLGDILFSAKRAVSNYYSDDYHYILETPDEIYYWSINYSTNQNVFLQEIFDENEMISIIERKLADITGEQIVSLSPLRWENRWSALSFTDPESVLKIKAVFDPYVQEKRENGSILVESGSFTYETTIPED